MNWCVLLLLWHTNKLTSEGLAAALTAAIEFWQGRCFWSEFLDCCIMQSKTHNGTVPEHMNCISFDQKTQPNPYNALQENTVAPAANGQTRTKPELVQHNFVNHPEVHRSDGRSLALPAWPYWSALPALPHAVQPMQGTKTNPTYITIYSMFINPCLHLGGRERRSKAETSLRVYYRVFP